MNGSQWIDRVEAARDTVGPFVDANGVMLIALCDYAKALVRGENWRGKNECDVTGSQCVCNYDEPIKTPFRRATVDEADRYWSAADSAAADSIA